MTRPKMPYPKHVADSPHEWRVMVRARIRSLRQAYSAARLGCFYHPDGGAEMEMISRALGRLEKITSPKEWGR